MKSFIIIILSLYGVCHGLNMQAQQINIRKYTIEDGLVNNDVLNIYQDRQGFIWLCTRGGLSRYDGSRFINYTTENGLTNDMINDIYEIAPQEFIVAQNSNGPRLLKNGRLSSLQPHSNLALNNFYTTGNTRLLATNDSNGVVEWTGGHFKPLDPARRESTSKLTILNDSTWLALHEHNSIQLVTPALQPLSPRLLMMATNTFTDSHHRTWVGTTHGLLLLNPVVQPGKPLAFIPLPKSFDLVILRESYISDFMEDSQGNCWITTNSGLVKINLEGHAEIFTDRDGLPALAVNCISEDRHHNIWIGTTLGLAKFSMNGEITAYAIRMPVSMNGLLSWAPVTENNLRLFDGKNIGNWDVFTGKLISSFCVDTSGYLLYHLPKGQLLVMKGKNWAIRYSGITGEDSKVIAWPGMVYGLITPVDQNNFVGTGGVTLFQVSDGKSTKKLQIDAGSFIYSLIIDRKNVLWAGTYSDGLFKIRMSGKPDSLRLETIDTLAGRLPDRNIRALYADRENETWIGTRYKGVVRLLELANGKYEVQNYGTREGLSSDFVLTINRDPAGNIWVGTMQGVDKLIPTGSGYRVFNFGKVNRFFSHVYSISFFKDRYAFGCDYPYVVYARDMQQDTMPPPAVYVTGIYGAGRDTIISPNEQHARLPYNKAQINFEFSAPQFINEDFTTYSYRLLGANDTAWSASGKSHSVYFASLSPGNYTFQVRAMGFNGKWGIPATYSFIVNTPFWQTTLFIVLIAAVAALAVYALYRYRIRQLMRLQLVRNRIATDLHDEIGSNLTNISILSNLSKNNLLQPQKASGFLQRISEEVSSSSQALDDIIWSVNTSHDTLEETAARMRRYAAELFDAANTGYELYLDPAFEEKKLIMEQRRDIYLLYKEAVNNISKHAGAKQVSIHLSIEHNELHLRIKDDGKGFETGKTTGRHGLQGMKDRVQKWKGRIEIVSAPGRGTSIEVWIPVSK